MENNTATTEEAIIAPVYYRLVNAITDKVMKLSHNSTDMKEVIEDVILYASIDNPQAGLLLEDFPKLLDECQIRIDVSPVPFIYTENTISNYLTLDIPKHDSYKPLTRVYQSNMLIY